MMAIAHKLRRRAAQAWRRLRGRSVPKASPLPGQFQPYNHTLPNRYPWLFEFARSNLANRRAPRLLSFGCSRGDEVVALRGYFPEAYIKGIDVMPANIEACLKRAREAPLEHVDFAVAADTRAEASGSFDAIFCLAVLCHGDLTTYRLDRSDSLLRFDEFCRVIEDFDRCLAPDGLLLLLTTNFRFSDTPSAEGFVPLLQARPEDLAPDVLFDRNNRLLPGETYRWVAFRKRSRAGGRRLR